MVRKSPLVSLSVVVLLLLSFTTPITAQTTSSDQVKLQVAKLGLGEKARATITLKNGSKVKGYVARADENDFVIRDRKTDAPTTIQYADVVKVQKNKGHSMARNLAIGIGIGVAAFVVVIGIVNSRLD